MTIQESTTFIIVGLTREGRKFRPSDWAERLCGVMSAFGAERKMKYSPYVGPGDYNGEKAVFVDGRLGEIEPMAYRFMLNFAQDNDLQIVDGVCSIDGNPVAPECGELPGDATGWRSWNYSNGGTQWTGSQIGAASHSVHQGDVDGWNFGTWNYSTTFPGNPTHSPSFSVLTGS